MTMLLRPMPFFGGRVSMHPHSLFAAAGHLESLSKDGDPLKVLA